MRTSIIRLGGLALGLLALHTRAARATDGHFLHGVGAINSAMGGVGVAHASSLLGAFYVNPAGLLAFHGTATELGFEMFKPERTISSAAGTATGSSTSSSEFVPVPAFGWSRELRPNTLAVGVGGLGIGGFGVDYHTDPTNPVLAPRPYGFGAVYSNFSLMKIIPAIAYRPTPGLRLGAALNVDWASLAVDPMPIAAPAVDPGPDGRMGTADDRAYYSRATDADGSFGVGAQIGMQYDVTPALAFGLAYTTPQVFQKFSYGAVYENPNLPTYNMPRTITFAMDVPAVYAAGLSWTPSPAFTMGADAKYFTYAQTRGFKEKGYAADGSVRGFGWRNIWTVASGLEYRPVSRVALRAGYNFSQNPVPDELSMFNAPAPAVVQHHVTGGVGYGFANGFGVNLGVYHAFKHAITGPFQTPAGAMPGTKVTSAMSENSLLLGFTFCPPGQTP
ncbi:MAG TPA: outer membrane protein transport protein [Gemmatimonadaceae bacterium]|nr:outer membrane protein transport protein [Gemmatimonadaceae bacterium]